MVFRIKAGEVSLSANGLGSLSIEVDQGKRLTIHKIAVKSTGDFKITDIRDSATGEHYITGTVYKDHMAYSGGYIVPLDTPIVINGPTKLIVDIGDLSGAANTVSIAFYCNEE